MMEYRIADKISSLISNLKGSSMNNILIYTDTGQIVHVMKEHDYRGWHKKVISIGISQERAPQEITKATFESKDKLQMLIKMLQNYADEMED